MKAVNNKMYLNQLNEADKAKNRREQVLASLARRGIIKSESA